MRQWLLVIGLLIATLAGVGTAQADFEDGQRAWDAGRHSEALREWRAAANVGDAKAMLALGRLYVQGLGVPQNYVQAHMWFSLAASRFEAEAVKERDALAARMSPEQVAKAQDLAATWQPGDTQPAASATSKPAGPPPPKAIREAQELLAALGYDPDPPDGQWGERTARAYQAFVRDANLPVTDTLTPAALKAMRAKARQAGAVSAPKTKAELPPEALHRAAKAGNLKGLEAALAAGADVNARDDKGWTALMYVVDKGYVLLVEPLLRAKADPDVRAPDGATALFMAVAHGHGEIIPLLMKAGADPTITGPKGKTATEIAQARYGDLTTALKQGEPSAVIALLAGKPFDDFAFERAQLQDTLEAYTEYLSAFPQGRHADEARDAEAYLSAQSQGTWEAYIEYLASFPSGRHVEEARRRQEAVEDAAFYRALSQGTAEAYAEYLASFPSGRYIEKARRRQAERERPPVSLTAASPSGTMGRECADCPEMIVVPAGRFRMGDLSGSGDDDERPVHEVTIAYPLAVGKYEVTFAEWDACVAGGGCTHQPDDKGWGRGTRPVINVSWDDAQEYVRWLSRETGKPYRLLSEAEWEYVARAGSTTQYPWGNDVGTNRANCDGCGSQWDDKNTAPVGSFQPNGFGLYDTAGNVWEWVEDCWNDSYAGAPRDGSAWTGGWFDECDGRVLRGGSWYVYPRFIRSAFRSRIDTVYHVDIVYGFRVARTLD